MNAPGVEEIAYYASQSPFTDPGEMSSLLADLPQDIGSLCRAANGLVIHFRLDDPLALGISEERMAEVDSRYVEDMLRRLRELDDRVLTERRAAKDRILGCCRDFTAVFLAMARAQDIPARARVGFSTYFFDGVKNDHEVAEVWDAAEGRWRLVDPQLKDGHVDPNDDVSIDPADVPRDRFLVAARAWQLCKAGEVDPKTFVIRPDIDLEITKGLPYISHNLVFDLAALNKMEMLLWDLWGLAGTVLHGKPATAEEGELLERIVAATDATNLDLAELRDLYEGSESLKVPQKVISLSPAKVGPREVDLSPSSQR